MRASEACLLAYLIREYGERCRGGGHMISVPDLGLTDISGDIEHRYNTTQRCTEIIYRPTPMVITVDGVREVVKFIEDLTNRDGSARGE